MSPNNGVPEYGMLSICIKESFRLLKATTLAIQVQKSVPHDSISKIPSSFNVLMHDLEGLQAGAGSEYAQKGDFVRSDPIIKHLLKQPKHQHPKAATSVRLHCQSPGVDIAMSAQPKKNSPSVLQGAILAISLDEQIANVLALSTIANVYMMQRSNLTQIPAGA